jgi:hypothetical protein
MGPNYLMWASQLLGPRKLTSFDDQNLSVGRSY